MAVRTDCGIFDISHMGRVILKGGRAQECLDFLTPSSLEPLKEGEAKYTVFLNEHGGVVDDLILYKKSPEEFRIIWNASNHAKNIRYLAPYLEAYELTLKDDKEETALLAIQGPRTLEICTHLQLPIPERRFRWLEFSFEGHRGIIARTGYTGEDGIEIWIQREGARKLFTLFLKQGALPCGLASRDSLRIEAGYPLYGNELSEELDPYAGGIGFVVDRKKEGYLGYPSLKKRTTPHPAYRLMGILCRGRVLPRPHYPIYDGSGKRIGDVTSGSYSPILKTGIGLARVLWETPEKLEVFFEVRNRREPALLIPPPLHKHPLGAPSPN
jgi:aminomethyltransferase